MLGIYTVARTLVDLAAVRGLRRGLRLAAITLASSLATLATPYGIDTWRAVAISIQNPMTRHVMADWRPLLVVLAQAFDEPHGGAIFLWIAIALVLALAISLAIAPRGDDLALVAVAAAINLGAFMAVRNAPLALIASAAPLTRHLGLARKRFAREAWDTAATAPSGARLSRTSQAFVGILAIVMLAASSLFSRRLPAAMRYPDGAVAFMRSHKLRGNILNYFAWGQYLIWHESPDSKIFIDGRYDLVYPPEVVREYLDFYAVRPDAAFVLDHYPPDYVLLPSDCAAARFLSARRDWQLIYRDSTAVLFARTGSSIARRSAAPTIGRASSSYFP